MYLSCFMLVYSIYCVVVSSLLFSPSIYKSCTCNMSSAPPASISLQAICGWESNVISYFSNFQENLLLLLFLVPVSELLSSGSVCRKVRSDDRRLKMMTMMTE